ncbi:hypothetical protein [Qipengyuania thermophila]|uniref:hypothetical protein n=1 Tax=Qipengyuania thermophila TaxID=2509361 RepID=UPI00101F3A04|nr:hypothetical protein [Qipengyuania thermophila]
MAAIAGPLGAEPPPGSADHALAAARAAYGPAPESEPCTAQEEAAIITGEIVVCRRRATEEHRLRGADEARRRHAAATMDAGDPRAPDPGPPPCRRGAPGCVHFGRVPPRIFAIDVTALPEAPPGSDADRIARGLAPQGLDAAAPP